MFARRLALCLTVALVAPLWSRTQPVTDGRTVQDGVFTEEQANRGQAQYEGYCLRCHGEDLTGANARALVGEDFLRNWTGLTLDGLLQRAQTMPSSELPTLPQDGRNVAPPQARMLTLLLEALLESTCVEQRVDAALLGGASDLRDLVRWHLADRHSDAGGGR